MAAASSLMTCLDIFTDDIRVNTNHPHRSGRIALPFAAEGENDRRDALSYAAAKRSTPNCKTSCDLICQTRNATRTPYRRTSNIAKSAVRNHAGASTLRYLMEKGRDVVSILDNHRMTPLAWVMGRR